MARAIRVSEIALTGPAGGGRLLGSTGGGGRGFRRAPAGVRGVDAGELNVGGFEIRLTRGGPGESGTAGRRALSGVVHLIPPSGCLGAVFSMAGIGGGFKTFHRGGSGFDATACCGWMSESWRRPVGRDVEAALVSKADTKREMVAMRCGGSLGGTMKPSGRGSPRRGRLDGRPSYIDLSGKTSHIIKIDILHCCNCATSQSTLR